MQKEEESKKVVKKVEGEKHKKIDKDNIVLIITILITILVGIFIGTSSMYVFLRNAGVLETEDKTSEKNINVSVTDDEAVIIDVVDDVKDSVVSIAVSELVFSPEKGVVDSTDNIGTGFIVDKNGLIITNQHVVSDTSAEYKVITSSGKEYDVVSIERDDVNDIALLKIDASNLKPVTLGNSDNLVVGQTVIAIGTPLGEYSGTVTTGVISGLNRDVTTSASWFGDSEKNYENVIQTDAAVNPGNSGGPLLNTKGEVIGINFATTANADNISFALPINIVKGRIEEYRTYGKFIKPYFGITYQVISEYLARYYTDLVPGILVVHVDPTSPAYDAGLQRGDIITAIEKDSVVDSSFVAILSKYKPGDKITVTYIRDGKSKTTEVTLREAD